MYKGYRSAQLKQHASAGCSKAKLARKAHTGPDSGNRSDKRNGAINVPGQQSFDHSEEVGVIEG